MFTHQAIEDVLSKVQKAIDDLQLRNFANIPVWVETLDHLVAEKLQQRLRGAVKEWRNSLVEYGVDLSDIDNEEEAKRLTAPDAPKIDVLKHEILIRNQVLDDLFCLPLSLHSRPHLSLIVSSLTLRLSHLTRIYFAHPHTALLGDVS